MKKVFQLTDPKKQPARVLEAVKHDIRKYVKREKRKELADPEATYWDFDCKIGATAQAATTIAYEELLKALDALQATDATEVYIEIMVKVVAKPPKPTREETAQKESTEEKPAEDVVSSEDTD